MFIELTKKGTLQVTTKDKHSYTLHPASVDKERGEFPRSDPPNDRLVAQIWNALKDVEVQNSIKVNTEKPDAVVVNRNSINPDCDLSLELGEVKAVCKAVFTDEVKARHALMKEKESLEAELSQEAKPKVKREPRKVPVIERVEGQLVRKMVEKEVEVKETEPVFDESGKVVGQQPIMEGGISDERRAEIKDRLKVIEQEI